VAGIGPVMSEWASWFGIGGGAQSAWPPKRSLRPTGSLAGRHSPRSNGNLR